MTSKFSTRRYKKGQVVKIRPQRGQSAARDADLEPYDGQTAEIMDSYWISPTPGQQFYIYTAKVLANGLRLTVHEDEIEPNL
jgi:hypothetical protein